MCIISALQKSTKNVSLNKLLTDNGFKTEEANRENAPAIERLPSQKMSNANLKKQ
jgi:hypothetical protein